MNASRRDYVRLPDGSALVERRMCKCGTSLTLYRGVWWEDSDIPHDCDEPGDETVTPADVAADEFTAHCPACDHRRHMTVTPAGLHVACAYCGSFWPDLWCVSWPPRDGRRPANIPARSRAHAERMAPKLNGRVQPWTETPELHAIMADALGRALASFGPRESATACCDLHSRTCEPPSELCCEECPEHLHPRHGDGSA